MTVKKSIVNAVMYAAALERYPRGKAPAKTTDPLMIARRNLTDI